MRRLVRCLVLALGLVCLTAAALLCWESQQEETQAASVSISVTERVQQAIVAQSLATQGVAEGATSAVASVEIDGTLYLGILLFPQLELELPVASVYSDAKLEETPCVYAGTVEENNLIIAAHNYNAHFRTIHQLTQGDTVTLLDGAGRQYTYTVTGQEVIGGDDVDLLLAGDWDLTLFTCLYGDNSRRVVVRLDRAAT